MAVAIDRCPRRPATRPILVFDPLPANCPHGRPIVGSGDLRTSECCMFVRHPHGRGWVTVEDRRIIWEREGQSGKKSE